MFVTHHVIHFVHIEVMGVRNTGDLLVPPLFFGLNLNVDLSPGVLARVDLGEHDTTALDAIHMKVEPDLRLGELYICPFISLVNAELDINAQGQPDLVLVLDLNSEHTALLYMVIFPVFEVRFWISQIESSIVGESNSIYALDFRFKFL